MLRPLILLLCLIGGALAEDLQARLQAASAGVHRLRLAFVQSKDLALFDQPVLTPGVIELDRQRAALRWEYTGRTVLILAGGKVRKWGADGREEIGFERDPNLQALRGQMQALLTGDWSAVRALFTIAETGDGPGLVLTPSDPALAKYIARLTIRFRADLSAPESLLLEAAGGDRTEYRFAAPEVDPDLAAARFTGP
jgi:hypothetical protein